MVMQYSPRVNANSEIFENFVFTPEQQYFGEFCGHNLDFKVISNFLMKYLDCNNNFNKGLRIENVDAGR